MTNFIYHITSQFAWSAAQKKGIYSTGSLADDGFIHCSEKNQILRVANSFFVNQHGLVILIIDPSKLNPEVRWEAGSDKADELFPHIYGLLNLEAVLCVLDFEPGGDGRFFLPQSLVPFDHE